MDVKIPTDGRSRREVPTGVGGCGRLDFVPKEKEILYESQSEGGSCR